MVRRQDNSIFRIESTYEKVVVFGWFIAWVHYFNDLSVAKREGKNGGL
jgi:hypothetical protein